MKPALRVRRTQVALALCIISALAACGGPSAQESLQAAQSSLAKQDQAAAIVQLKNALQRDPNLLEARLLLGQALLHVGDARGASIELAKVREQGFPDEQVAPALARALLAQGQYSQLIKGFSDTKLASAPEMADLQASLATANAALGNLSQASAIGAAALATDPSSIRAQLTNARLLATLKGAQEGLRALETTLNKAPTNAEAWQLKGSLLAATGRSAEAISAYKRATDLDRNNLPARVGILSILLDQKNTEAATTELKALRAAKTGHVLAQVFAAMLALQQDDIKTAHESIQNPLKLNPQDPRILFLAGAIEFRRGSLLQAEKLLIQSVQIAPELGKPRALLAQVQLRMGDADKALQALGPLLTENGTSADAFSIAAEAYLQQGNNERAEQALIKAAKLNPNAPHSRTSLALIQINKGRIEEGLEQLRSIAASSTETIADMALITTLAQRKSWEDALTAIKALENKSPKRAGISHLRGQIEAARGNKEGARTAFMAAVELDPDFFPAAASLAQMDIEAQQPEAAAAHFKRILARQPGNVQANMGLIGLKAQAGATVTEQAKALKELVDRLPAEARPRLALIQLQLRHKQTVNAVETARAAAEALPESPDIVKALAQATAAAGQFEEAVKALTKLATLQPKSPEPALLLAQLYTARGDTNNASLQLKRALSIRPGDRTAELALISTEISRGNLVEARRLADAVVAKDSKNPLTYSIQGDIDVMQRNWSEAIRNYQKALSLLPHPDVAIKLHRVLATGGKPREARQFAIDWIAKHPTQLSFQTYVADAALVEKDYATAREHYLAVLKAQPDNPIIANNVAWVLSQTKDPNALQYAERANKLAPDNPSFLDTLAKIHAEAGRLDAALPIQKRAVQLAPNAPEFRLQLAQLYIDAGLKNEARDELRQLSAMGDRLKHQDKLRQLMDRL
ncbi:MAG: XrtA/PEP-CTERM system TPR-repeat protein PrsT [Roseateles asaccharophilus]|uniref:XrtA/PEP-CTERM system TPR-repeat protein PrsT n=1 Tax=Roseateles asaccharophilus TaxID=582607 RepID=UPI00391965E6